MTDDDSTSLSRRQVIQAGAATLAAAQTSAVVVSQLTASTPAIAQPARGYTVADYIIARLRQHNVSTLFGIPGVTCDPIFAAAETGGMASVVASSDFEAGYAADGYARMRGLGAVAATYGVGMMSLIGAISGAYAERSPVVVINGGPTKSDLANLRDFGLFFSHSNGREQSDLAMFGEVTAGTFRPETASDVPKVVDAAITTALVKKRPVYLEIPKNLWDATCAKPQGTLDVTIKPSGEEARLAADMIAKLKAATKPVLLLGVEIDRFGLADDVTALISKLRLPWATTLLGKSVIAEQTPGFIGVYGGSHAAPTVVSAIHGADALLALGCVPGLQMRGAFAKSSNGGYVPKDTVTLVANDIVRVGGREAGAASLKAIVAELSRQAWRADPAIAERVRPAGLSFEQRREKSRPALLLLSKATSPE